MRGVFGIFYLCDKRCIRNMGDKIKDKENKDPEYVFFDRDKSHNTSFYKKTPGVCTNTKMELQKIPRTTECPPSIIMGGKHSVKASTSKMTSGNYWQDPSILLGEEENNGNGGEEISGNSWVGVERNQEYMGSSGEMQTGHRGGSRERSPGHRGGSRERNPGHRERDGRVGNMGSAGEFETGHKERDREFNIVELMDTENSTDLAVTEQGNVDLTERGSKSHRKRKGKGGNNRGNKKKLGNLSRYSQREIDREIERNAKKTNEQIQIKSMKQILGDPWDAVCFDDKKQFALHFYYTNLQVNNCWCCVDFDLIGGGGRRFLTIIFQ